MRLYIVVQKTLSSGLKMAQACHALRQFIEAYPEIDHAWYHESNNIVVLEHGDMPGIMKTLD